MPAGPHRMRDRTGGRGGWERAKGELIPMADELKGKKIAFLVANEGTEQIELTRPWDAVREAGAEAELIAPAAGGVQAFNHLDRADDYDGLVLPGGVANPDQLRTVPAAVQFARGFFEAGKPVGVICHGPWTLVEADVLRGRTITSWPSLKTDIENAGGNWVDEEVHVDSGLVSSRKPDDLDAFCAKIVEEFADGVNAEQREATVGAS